MATIRELKWLSGKINFKTTKNITGDKWGHLIVFKMSAKIEVINLNASNKYASKYVKHTDR